MQRCGQWLTVLGIAMATGTAIAAETYPSKPVRIVVPAGAGGNLDLTARAIGTRMAESLGQPVVVENRPGGNMLPGNQAVAKSAPDGYTLLAISNAFAILPNLFANAGYDPVRDYTGIGLMNRAPLLLVTTPSIPAKSVKELIVYAGANPSKVSYASGGTGTTTHIAAAMFWQLAGIDVLHVPYKGNAPALPDVMSGRVTLIFDPINTSAPHVREGKFRALGVTTATRSALFPDLPTIAESGLQGYDFSIYTGLVAPAGTLRDVVSKLHSALARATSSPELRERFAAEGTELLTGGNPDQFNEFMRQEVARYAKVVKEGNIKAE